MIIKINHLQAEMLKGYVSRELISYNEEIESWEKNGLINSDTGKEMIAWRDALNDLLLQINKEQKDAK
jgi:hypothetical protein